MNQIKNICIYGVGGVGGYFGAKIIDGDKNKDLNVAFIARGKQLETIKKNGLILKTEDRIIKVKSNLATENVHDIEKIDLMLICVKSYDLDGVINCIKDKIKDDTILIPLLNGVDIYERIRKNLERGFVLPACVYVGTHIEDYGIVLQKGGDGRIIFGKDPRRINYYPEEVMEFFEKLKINFSYQENPYKEIWTKYMFIAAYGLVTAKTGKTLGEVLGNNDLLSDVESIIREIKLIADKKRVSLDRDVIKNSIEKARSFPYETKTSFQRDVENPKKKNERDLFGGTIIRLGKEYCIDTKYTEKYYI
ncbi:MAG TPA: 2-dehydropantoate 2-reductase [Methanofastidiosum sp.]|jgi:2-dehydropantoate 2-reductase|nr:2-dehydropantoate 2-reductase [Methanofastidiosum sp.]